MKFILITALTFTFNAFALTIDKNSVDLGSLQVGVPFSEKRLVSLTVENKDLTEATSVNFALVQAADSDQDKVFKILRNTCTGNLAVGAKCSILLKAQAVIEGDIENPSYISPEGLLNASFSLVSSHGVEPFSISADINNIIDFHKEYAVDIVRDETEDQKYRISLKDSSQGETNIVCPAKSGDAVGEAYCGSLGAEYQNKECVNSDKVFSELSYKTCSLVAQVLPKDSEKVYEIKLSHNLGNRYPKSCLDLMAYRGITDSGKYHIWNNNDEKMEVYCDMDTDQGGWTLFTYAGTINGSKTNTVGTSCYAPIFCEFGSYDADAISTRSSFSKLNLFHNKIENDSEFLARRTGNPNNIMIWEVSKKSDYLNKILTQRPDHMRLSRNGGSTFETKNPTALFGGGATMPSYSGFDWNDHDNSGSGGYTVGLNHRQLLYWEALDRSGDYTEKQWFHGQPLAFGTSDNAENRLQDFEFYFKEVLYKLPRSCKEALERNPSYLGNDGAYTIDYDGFKRGAEPMQVYCDMTTRGGGWTMITNMYSGSKITPYSNFGTPSMNADYGSNNAYKGAYNEIMVRYGSNYENSVESGVIADKTLSTSSPVLYSGDFRLEWNNSGSAAGCRHYALDVQNSCSQGGSYACYNTSEAGIERSSSASWCHSAFRGRMAVFVK